jgi:isoleucyl-tRNA synthetase
MFGAVHQDITYALIFDRSEKEYFVLAESLVSKYYKNSEDCHLLYRLKGKNFIGLNYEPLFDYYYSSEYIKSEYHSQVHEIVHADFVTSESGTGIAHQAPAYGEDDYNLIATRFPREDAKDWLFDPVDQHGDFTDEVPDLAGINVIEANKEVIRLLKESGKIVKVETIDHSYPHCPRTKTPLIYKAIESRFLKEDQLKAQTVPSTDEQYFVPETVKKRFVNGLASAPDWNISRTRFRGCPLPVWENPDDPEERLIV